MSEKLQWEDYEISGQRAGEAADYMEAFMASAFPDPEDRIYMDENYFSIMHHKIAEAEKEFSVTFTLSL